MGARDAEYTRKGFAMTDTSNTPAAPGDDAPPGQAGTGEDLCGHCGGSGEMAGGEPCEVCAGTGKVIVGIGGG